MYFFIFMSADRCGWWNWWTSDPSVLICDCNLICGLWPLTGWHVHAAPERRWPGRADQRSGYLRAHSRWCGHANQSQLWGPIRRAHPARKTQWYDPPGCCFTNIILIFLIFDWFIIWNNVIVFVLFTRSFVIIFI